MSGTIAITFREILLILHTILFGISCAGALIISVPLLIYHQLVVIAARIFRPDLANVVVSNQALLAHDRLHDEDKVTFNICTWHVFKDPLSVGNLRKLVQENLVTRRKGDGTLEFPEFQQYYEPFGGYLFWKWDRNFDVSNHVRYFERENGNNGVINEKELQKIISKLLTTRWPRNRSLWEILAINRYQPTKEDKEKSVLIIRFHHSLADGYSYLNFVVRGLCKAENLVAAVQSSHKLSAFQNICRTLAAPFKQPYDFVKMFNTMEPDKSPWMLRSRTDLQKQYTTVWSQAISVEKIKKIKSRYKVSFQAVLNSIVSGAIQQLMSRAGQEVPEKMMSFVPFPLPNHPGGLRIHTNFSLIKLPVGEKHPLKRLQLAQTFWEEEAKSSAQWMARKFYSWIGWLPWIFSQNIYDTYTTVGLSCFPGISGDIYLDSNKVLEVNFTVGTQRGTTGATFTTLSCFNSLRFVMAIDKAIYSHYDGIADDFNEFVQQEIASLLDAEKTSDRTETGAEPKS